ncbi:sigma-70 family RNA polymerase sigma factor [Streptomyces sp. NPDC004267]|uniref:sigma-70 family RNA polymerase sigma factor n=1 Tax=Streptomyces sp. NPDC004267 TaxID=3364694 RepID=UPI0036B06C33
MSGDSRDETSAAAGTTEPDGLPAGQVPSQGGPTGASGPGATTAAGAVSGAGAASGAGAVEPSVPQQREGGSSAHLAGDDAESGSVLPPPVDLPPSDAELVQLMREGEDSAYEELFRRHSEAVRRYARSCCRDADTADDLTAEVFASTLQAVRRGAGPEQAVRAYLLTSVRRVAATWTRTQKREQLVEDFAVFAEDAARSSEVSDGTSAFAGADLGADVLAMHEAEQSLAMQAFRSLPERWQAVLWHTTVEEESPSEVAPLFGLTANATAVLASRAREGLKQAYLQAHVSQSLTSGGDCARYADRLGAFARGGLRMRAERGLRKHLDECAKCRLAAGELAHVNSGIPALLPVAVIGWFAAGYSLKAAGVVAGGVAGAGAAGAAAAATGTGATGTAGASSAAAAEGLGIPAKAGIAAVAAVAATAGLVWALTGSDAEPVAKPTATPTVVAPVEARPPAPKPAPKPSSRPAPPPVQAAPPAPAPKPKPTPTPSAKPSPRPTPSPKPRPKTTPRPTPSRTTPKPVPAPAAYQLSELQYGIAGDGTKPEVDLAGSSWMWQRSGLSMNGTRYAHGVTVNAPSSLLINLNRQCTGYDALVGVDDMTVPLVKPAGVRFSVYADGERVWRSAVVRPGDAPIPVHVGLSGRHTLRLVVEQHTPFGRAVVADWADSRISCS